MDAVSGSRYETYDDVTCSLKHENDMKASDARSENLDGGIDADLTHDRQSILDKFTTS